MNPDALAGIGVLSFLVTAVIGLVSIAFVFYLFVMLLLIQGHLRAMREELVVVTAALRAINHTLTQAKP